MEIRLDGKTAFVTGSTKGIGYAIARGLANSGAIVYINGRDEDRVENAVAKLRAEVKNAQIHGIATDLTLAQGAMIAFNDLPQTDILINNLGIYGPKPFTEISDADWSQMLNTNVISAARLCRFYLPKMLKNNWGRIVFISSESAINIPDDMIHYGVSKAAIQGLSRGIAKLTKGTSVTVNSVLPGPTMTEGVADFFSKIVEDNGKSLEETGNEFVRNHRSSSILGRFATPDEVANMVIYIASAQASATNGAALRVDGGIVETIL